MTTSGSTAKKSGLLSMLAHHPAVISDEPPDSLSSNTLQQPSIPPLAPTEATHSSDYSLPTSKAAPPSNKLNSLLSAYDSDSGSDSESDTQPSTKRSRPEPETPSNTSQRDSASTASKSHGETTVPAVTSRKPTSDAPFRPFDASAVESDSDSDSDVVGPADALLGPDLTHILGSSLGSGRSTDLDTPFSYSSERSFVGPARPADHQSQSYSYPEYGSEASDAVQQSGFEGQHAAPAATPLAPRVPSGLRRMMEDRPEAVIDVSVPAKLASDAELLKQITADEQSRQWMARFSHGPDSRAKLALEANPDIATAQHGGHGVGAPTEKRKHQITWLAEQARAREADLQKAWAQGKMNRSMAAQRYGFK